MKANSFVAVTFVNTPVFVKTLPWKEAFSAPFTFANILMVAVRSRKRKEVLVVKYTLARAQKTATALPKQEALFVPVIFANIPMTAWTHNLKEKLFA